jgi:mRNA interferase MazF
MCDFNPTTGTEQSGIRPAVILQVDRADAVSPHTIVVPLTTTIRRVVLPSHVLISARSGGLTQESVVLCEQIRVIDKSRIIRTLGYLDKAHMDAIARAVRAILGV